MVNAAAACNSVL